MAVIGDAIILQKQKTLTPANQPFYTSGIEDMVEGETELAYNKLYFVYEEVKVEEENT